MDKPDSEMSDSALLYQIAEDIAFFRRMVESLLGQNGHVDAVRAAGLRKTLRRAARDAT